ncbi:MAG TPA: hypothetical protein G4O13_07815, partial [Dehalococcoidia bacterium]|nr:hypothetical protein [Dehalococcoidia bacterium]
QGFLIGQRVANKLNVPPDSVVLIYDPFDHRQIIGHAYPFQNEGL